jgi:hypothetical protein
MATFVLPTGKTVEKDAKYCVATKTNGRWHHKFFKSYKGADNEYSSTKAYLRNPNMVAYYGLEDCKLIKPQT